jgi:hypothetical protein
MISYTVFQFTQRAIENHSTHHAWHACHRLPTPDLDHIAFDEGMTDELEWIWKEVVMA